MQVERDDELAGRVIAITGGARGIGLATARELCRRGARVAIGDIDLDLLRREADGLGAHAAHLDVRRRDSFEEFLRAVTEEVGPLDVLVNNAGVAPLGPFLQEDAALTDTQIDVNLRGVIHGMRAALPQMLARRRGHIINIASLAGRFALPGAAVYSATKFAVIGLTEAVAAEHRGSDVHFTAVLPSIVNTELASGLDETPRLIPRVEPEDIAAAVADAILHPRLMVPVPGYLGAATSLLGLTPAWMETLVRKAIGDDTAMHGISGTGRAPYAARLAALVARSGDHRS